MSLRIKPLRVIADLHGQVEVPEPEIRTLSTGSIQTIWDTISSSKRGQYLREGRTVAQAQDLFAEWFDGLPLMERVRLEQENGLDGNIFFPLQIQLQIQRTDIFHSYVYEWTSPGREESRCEMVVNFPERNSSTSAAAPKGRKSGILSPERARRRADFCVRRAMSMQQAFGVFSPLEITLWHLDAPKTLADPIRINSGYTEFPESGRKRRIVIYRREELLKVLTHEMIHALGLDGNQNDTGHSRRLTDRFCLCDRSDTTMTRPEEAYTDAWAIIINAHLRGTPIREEQIHCVEQCASLLVWFGFRSVEDFERATSPTGSGCVPQTTSLLSYYVLKSALLSNLETFVRSFPEVWIDHPLFARVTEKSLDRAAWRQEVRNAAAGMTRDKLRGRTMRMSVTLS